MRQGIYRVARVTHGAADEHSNHAGRLAVVNGHIQVLEDTKDGFLSHTFPDGAVDERAQRRWAQLCSSPYFKVTVEGSMDGDSQEMAQPDVKPEESYDIVDGKDEPKLLEAYGENLFLDGKRLGPQQVEDLQRRVHLGELHILPRVQQ